ncbi:MAG: tRNA dihydrouridine synthase DusB [Desulfuromonas sp.]|nr:tRNA dihydrouridine synthase DusB [Desulfuromonas sp.]
MSITPLTIKTLNLENNVVLAPMAGITNSPYRQINQRAGAALTYSEMISANGLIRDGKRTLELLKRHSSEAPFAVQLFGEDPKVLAEAAKISSDYGELLDLNMGCPVKKVVRSGAGSALLQNPSLVAAAISAIRRASSLPLTIKFRSGWDKSSINFLDIGKIAEQSGADALILHPRTRCQGFSGHSNWDHITQLKQAVSIPVIGSGDINCAQDAITMLQTTGCDGVMIGRGAYGNPWLITDILRLQCGEQPLPISLQQRLKTIMEHLELHKEIFGEHKTVTDMRKHLCWYSRSMNGASEFRSQVNRIHSYADLLKTTKQFFSRPSLI